MAAGDQCSWPGLQAQYLKAPPSRFCGWWTDGKVKITFFLGGRAGRGAMPVKAVPTTPLLPPDWPGSCFSGVQSLASPWVPLGDGLCHPCDRELQSFLPEWPPHP